MKKLFLLTIIAFFAFSSIKAQEGFSFGLRAIPTFNWVTVSDTIADFKYENAGAKMGFAFGPSLRYTLTDNFNVDISGIFTWQKFGIDITNDPKYNSTPSSISETYKVQFLQIPLNLNGQFEVAPDLEAIVNFGVGAGLNLKSSRLVVDNNDPNAYSSEYDTRIDMLTFIDFYLTAGLGAVYNLEDNLHLSLTIQYNNGIIDGWDDDKNTIPDTNTKIETPLNIKHKNIALSIGFYIDL